MGEIFSIVIAAILTDNVVLNQSIGICPFLGVSKKTSSAVGMGLAVTLVIAIASVVCWILYEFVLAPLANTTGPLREGRPFLKSSILPHISPLSPRFEQP